MLGERTKAGRLVSVGPIFSLGRSRLTSRKFSVCMATFEVGATGTAFDAIENLMKVMNPTNFRKEKTQRI